MAKAKANPKNVPTAANVLEILSLLLSVSVLAAVTQHVDHLSQFSTQLVATARSQGLTDYVNVKADFQLVPLVPLAIIIFIIALVSRRKVSTLLLVSFTIFACAIFVSLFGIHFAHPGISGF
jgi:mannose/fructose/N-acetylgalactosamine-specific phosphotransferase system component IID